MDKIFITKLELENFQKHAHLVLEFVDGINIIIGDTDIGKSCIVRAIRWIFFNEPKLNIRKEGTKKTSVKVWLNTGNIVERIKSDTVNAYIINEDNKKRYDSINKTIPEEVRKILGIYPFEVDNEEIILNISNQISMPFLMDKSGTFRNKLFNKKTRCR
jgi:predicted ATP-dependent endonuclease of OLD family